MPLPAETPPDLGIVETRLRIGSALAAIGVILVVWAAAGVALVAWGSR